MVLYIIDDEKNIRDSLSQYIPWETLGISEIITAKNGVDALDKMAEIAPDIVLTDVRMPKMNGIDLSIRLRQLFPDCVIIFLSGYADKEYLKSAIHVRAIQYIEKPVDMNVIKDVVQSAVTQLLEEKQLKQNIDYLQNFYDENLSYFRQDLTKQLVNSDSITSILEEKFISHQIAIYNRHLYTLAYVHINWPTAMSPRNQKSIEDELLRISNTGAWTTKTLTGFNDAHHFILILGDSFTEANKALLITPIKDYINNHSPSLSYSIGMSSPYITLEKTKLAYQEASDASTMQFYFGINQMFNSCDLKSDSIPLDAKNYQPFKNSLMDNDPRKALQQVTHLRRCLLDKKISVNQVKLIYREWITALLEVALDKGIYLSDTSDDTPNLIDKMEACILFTHVHQLLEKTVADYFKDVERLNKVGSRAVEIMRYIDEHHSDNQLSVNVIALHFELSQAYLCSYFKKVVGTTINQYITDIRISKAKQLLNDTNSKVYEIATQIGFTDTNYFSVLFKKHVGMTPLEYRDKI